MIPKENNFAYIDGANLYKAIEELDWSLDYGKLRVWLSEKYHVKKAYLFLGFVAKYKNLYTYLQESGFILVYKEITYDGAGKTKGNCDVALVLKAVVDFYEKQYDKAVIISSDGDYAEFVDFLKKKNILRVLISPNNRCSFLLRKLNIPLLYLHTQKLKLKTS